MWLGQAVPRFKEYRLKKKNYLIMAIFTGIIDFFKNNINIKFKDVLRSTGLLGVIGLVLYITNPAYFFGIVSHDHTSNKLKDSGIVVFSEDRLSDFNGIKENKLYLAVLGTVFDVTSGARYYSKGESYHYFVGKDGSRALITGEFTNESENKDDVIDLTCPNIFGLLNWKETFSKKYKILGVLNGRHYDENGKETVYHQEFLNKIQLCQEEKNAIKEQDKKYPPCNISWNADEGSKVWCTKSSGGIKRDWVGYPRQFFQPGQTKPKCVCVPLQEDSSTGQFKKYDNCPDFSTSCIVSTN